MFCRPVIAIIVATLVLSFAKDILMPLTMAALLAVIFSPIASRLDRFVGSFVSAALVVIAAVTIVAGIGYFVTVELTTRRGSGHRLYRQYRDQADRVEGEYA